MYCVTVPSEEIGHNRYRIATEHDVFFTVRNMAFENKDEAMVWMIDNQRGRRNLSKEQLLALGWKRAELLEEKARENIAKGQQMGGLTHSSSFQKSETSIPETEKINTTAEAAKFAGVSVDTASKYKKVMQEAPEEIKEEVKKPRTAAGRK